MTICIGAVADGGRHIVVAADRMFTIGPPLNVEFEPPISKIESLDGSCVALGSGSSLAVAEIVQRAQKQLALHPSKQIDYVAKAILDQYVKYRDECLEQQVIKPSLGPDFETFRSKGGTLPQYLQPQGQIYGQIYMTCNQYNLGLEIVIAGIDDSGSHLYVVAHPGQVVCFDKIGYAMTGSGATHASIRLALELQHPKMALDECLAAVYAAKKASEVAPGVGQETEMFVISAKDSWRVPDELIATLKATVEKEKAKPDVSAIGELYGKLRKDS